MIERFQGSYEWLSNFAYCQVRLDGISYPSVEHAYQSAKSTDPDWKRYCQTEKNPGKVKRESRKVRLIPNWDSYKVQVMRQLIDQKFDQQPFKNLLINTGNDHIQEGNTWNDVFWGVDLRSKSGKNILGNLIMEKRVRLFNETNNMK